MAEDVIEVSRQRAQDIANVLSASNSPTVKAMASELRMAIGNWKPMSTLKGGFGDTSTATLIELDALDHKTGSVAVMVRIPGQDPIDCIALLETRDSLPCFVPAEQYAGWRLFQFDDDPSFDPS